MAATVWISHRGVAVEFVAYIDESGDEGFNFGAGSSEWFVLSGVVVDKANDLATVKLLDRVRATLALPPKTGLHFRKMKHHQRVPYIAEIAGSNLCAITILVHKPSLRAAAFTASPHRLYFYTTRYLLERIGWYCRNHREDGLHGTGHAELVFSNRGGMSHADLAGYVNWLKWRSGSDPTIRIEWSVIRPEEIWAYSPMKRMGLQVADAVASGFYQAIEPQYGFTEHRYARMLRPIVFRRGRHSSYGLKFIPGDHPGGLRG